MVCSSARCAACTCSLQVLMAIVYLGELCWLPSVFPVQATTYDLRPTTYNTCQNLPHPPSRRAQGEEAMPRHLRHPRKSAFISLLFTLVVTLWLGGTLSACGSALRPGTVDQGTPTPPVGTATPPVGTAQGTLHGTVVAGPTCPVEPAEGPWPPKPVPARGVAIAPPDGS